MPPTIEVAKSSNTDPCSLFKKHPSSPAMSEAPTSSNSFSLPLQKTEMEATEPVPQLTGNLIYRNPGGDLRLPYSRYHGLCHMIDFPGNVWVNKLEFGLNLVRRDHQGGRHSSKIAMLQCPEGFGKSTFLNMSAFQNDTSRDDEYFEYFSTSQPTPSVPLTEVERLVLCLDFDHLGLTLDPEELRLALNDHISSVLTSFLKRYGHILRVPEEEISSIIHEDDGGGSLRLVLSLMYGSPAQLYLFVDNFNVPVINCERTDVRAVIEILQEHFVRPVRAGIRNGDISGGCIVGRPAHEVPHYAMEVCDMFDTIGADLSDDEYMSGAVGLSATEIKALAREILGAGEDTFMSQVEKALKPYYMAGIPRYSFTGVFTLLKGQTGQEDPQIRAGVIHRFDDAYSVVHDEMDNDC